MLKMITRTLALAALIGSVATISQAACYADYKAKRDNPLKLHYGVMELPDAACASTQAAAAQISARLGSQGWILLNVISVFDASGLGQRRDSAGEYYLRY